MKQTEETLRKKEIGNIAATENNDDYNDTFADQLHDNPTRNNSHSYVELNLKSYISK